MKNDVLFLSILYPREGCSYEKYVISHRSQNISAVQYELLDALAADEKIQCTLLNTLLVPLFPHGYKRPVVTGETWDVPGFEASYHHPFVNVRGIYSGSLFYGARPYLKKWALARSVPNKKIAIAYSLTTYTLKAMRYLKQLNPDIVTAIIVPDLPQYTYPEEKNILKRLHVLFAKKRIIYNTNQLFHYVDKAILFSEKMIEELACKDRFMVFEGVSTGQFAELNEERLFPTDKKEILYAGGLTSAYGVGLLLDAFALLAGEQYRLIIAGRGELEGTVKAAAARDHRIVYLGEIPRKRLMALEKGADILVNPRVNSGRFTRYSFPSKNMEYMSSGTPMIGFRLDGIPAEYDRYMTYFEQETAECLMHAIEHACTTHWDDVLERAKAAQTYVLEEKNSLAWMKRITAFLNNKS